MRTLFNRPIRKGVTDEFYPETVSIDEFGTEFINSFKAFQDNMIANGGVAIQPKYIEEWVEQYLAWLDIEQE